MSKGEIAKSNYQSGLNCAQAVAVSFKEELNLDEITIKKLIVGFGGGFGKQRLVCGAVSGMTMVLGYLNSDTKNKLEIYAIIKEACDKVKEKLGSIICADLIGEKKIPCADICQIVADITAEMIEKSK